MLIGITPGKPREVHLFFKMVTNVAGALFAMDFPKRFFRRHFFSFSGSGIAVSFARRANPEHTSDHDSYRVDEECGHI